MLLLTHIICSLLISCLFPSKFYLILIGGVVPDIIDYAFRLKHRSKITHNLLLSTILLVISPYIGIGHLHHLILDVFTIQGVYFGKKRIRIVKARSNDYLANCACILLHLLFLTINL